MWGIFVLDSGFSLHRPVTAPSRKQENVRREFALDFDTIEDGNVGEDVGGMPSLVSHDGYEEVINEPVNTPQARWEISETSSQR